MRTLFKGYSLALLLLVGGVFLSTNLAADDNSSSIGTEMSSQNDKIIADLLKKYPSLGSSESKSKAVGDLLMRLGYLVYNQDGWTPTQIDIINSFIKNAVSIDWKSGTITEDSEECAGNMTAELIALTANPAALGPPNLKQIPHIMDDIVTIFNIPMTNPDVKKHYDQAKEILTELGGKEIDIKYFDDDTAAGDKHREAWVILIANPLKMIIDRKECFKIKFASTAMDAVTQTVTDPAYSNDSVQALQAKADAVEVNASNANVQFKAGIWIDEMSVAILETDIIPQDSKGYKVMKFVSWLLDVVFAR